MSTSVTIKYECGGCDAEITTESIPVRARHESAFGGPLVKVRVVDKIDVEEHVADGWVVFDPYTLCTYCPECWMLIEYGRP